MPPRKKFLEYDKKGNPRWVAREPKKTKTKAKWPIFSDAAGVAPSQVGEARQKFAELGLKTEVLEDGRVVFESQKHRKQHCEAVGLYDRNASYGDPQKNDAIDAREKTGLFD
jgi:hypothetical protein